VPTFTTPEPVAVTLEVSSGRVTIAASDRADTVVQISPADQASSSDVKAAEHVQVDYSGGRLLIKEPEQRGLGKFIGKGGAIDVAIDIPTGSSLQADVADAEIHAAGLLGECQLNTAAGPVRLDRTGTLHAATASGSLTIEQVTGYANVDGSSGKVRIREIDGSAVIKSANGDIWVGSATNDLNLSTANGNIFVDRADASVAAKTSNGSIRAGQVTRGQVELMTAAGELEIGVAQGSAAWIDAQSKTGAVHNSLAVHDSPDQFANTVKVHARTWSGDIMIRRSPDHSSSSTE